MTEQQDVHEQSLGMTSRLGPVEIDWPRTIGYYSGIGLAWVFELIEPPLAIFIAAIPLLHMLNRPSAKAPVRFIGQILEGTTKPVGGSAEATIQLTETKGSASHRPPRPSILDEARQLVNQGRKK